jgi:hypothetical protein
MSEVFALEKQLAGFKKAVELKAIAERLAQNPDFKKLIMEEFMVNEAARYVHTSADPAMNAEQRADALAIAQAGGHLKRYLSVIMQMGFSAENQMVSLEEAIEQARLEEDAE